jgi:hypothetical protein
MKKSYYIIGGILFGIGAFVLFNKIKKGNLKLNTYNEILVKNENNLEPPMEAPSLATPTFV